VSKSLLACLLALWGGLGAKPQRNVLGLHGGPDHLYHMVSQGFQIRLFSQPGIEDGKRLRGVVLASVEASVYETLYTPPKRVEEGCYYQREATTARVDP
jgi:hypothetical protein